MAFSKSFDLTTPVGATTPADQLDTIIQDLKAAIQERENVDHYWPLNANKVDDAEAGEHQKVTLNAVLGADPDPGTGKGALYTKTVGGKPELFWQDADDNVIQLTNGGKLHSSAGLTITGDSVLTGKLDVAGNIDPTSYETTRGGFKDEDDMASDSATKVASQQSIKAYVDGQVAAVAFGNYGSTTTLTSSVPTSETDEVAATQATTDLLVFATCRNTTTSSKRVIFRGYTGATSSPTTFRAIMSLWGDGQTIAGLGTSFVMFVKKGQYYKITGIGQSGYVSSVTRTYCEVPIGS